MVLSANMSLLLFLTCSSKFGPVFGFHGRGTYRNPTSGVPFLGAKRHFGLFVFGRPGLNRGSPNSPRRGSASPASPLARGQPAAAGLRAWALPCGAGRAALALLHQLRDPDPRPGWRPGGALGQFEG